MTTTDSTARLELQLTSASKTMIERAAAVNNQSLGDYSVSRLVEVARRDLLEHETLVLSDRDRDLFLAMLAEDAEPNEALKRAAKRYKRFRDTGRIPPLED